MDDIIIDIDDSYETIPLIYNNDIDVTNINNILLIDSTVRENNTFIDSSNIYTFPIVYNYYSDRTELKQLLLNKFSLNQLSRIAFVFHNSNIYSKKFLNNNCFFDNESDPINENVQFLIDIIKEFNIKNVDFLACNTLQYDNWNKYYEILKSNTNVIVGASNDETGNIKYGGNWLMENTLEDLKNIYFDENIENYTSKLAVYINITKSSSSSIYIKELTNGEIYYSTTNNKDDNIDTGVWERVNFNDDWQLVITNLPLDTTTQFTINILTNITLKNANNGFLLASNYITINGNENIFTAKDVLNWRGLIETNLSISNINITNIIINKTENTTLASNAGYLLYRDSFKNASGINTR